MIEKTLPSPHQSERIHGQGAVRLIVAHTPEGPYGSMLGYITHPGRKCHAGERRVSYHDLIKEDGSEVTHLVPYSEKAWHAGALNSSSEGIALAGFARDFELNTSGDRRVVGWDFNLDGEQALARQIAKRLKARGLQPTWTTDTTKGGFCRHADLQDDRSDPTPDVAEWKVFVGMVQHEFKKLTAATWPKPIPAWFWLWAKWRLQGAPKGQRPSSAPRIIKPWAWLRLAALIRMRKA